MGKRNVYQLAAWMRKAGPHSKAKRPEKDVFDHIQEFTDEEMEEMKARKCVSLYPTLGNKVRVVDGGVHHLEVGQVVAYNNGAYGIVFDWDTDMCPVYYQPIHLEIVS